MRPFILRLSTVQSTPPGLKRKTTILTIIFRNLGLLWHLRCWIATSTGLYLILFGDPNFSDPGEVKVEHDIQHSSIHHIKADVGDRQSLSSIVDEIGGGGLDFLVNNAGTTQKARKDCFSADVEYYRINLTPQAYLISSNPKTPNASKLRRHPPLHRGPSQRAPHGVAHGLPRRRNRPSTADPRSPLRVHADPLGRTQWAPTQTVSTDRNRPAYIAPQQIDPDINLVPELTQRGGGI